MDIKEVYVCKYKITGWPIAFLDKSLADAWVAQDPEWRYYDTVKVHYEF